MKRITRYAIFHNGELFYRSRLSEVLEYLTSVGLGTDDVLYYVSGGVVIVDCD